MRVEKLEDSLLIVDVGETYLTKDGHLVTITEKLQGGSLIFVGVPFGERGPGLLYSRNGELDSEVAKGLSDGNLDRRVILKDLSTKINVVSGEISEGPPQDLVSYIAGLKRICREQGLTVSVSIT
jgi:hypothetical protein